MSRAVTELTAEPVVGPCRGKAIVVLATPLSPRDVYFVSACLQGHQIPNVKYRLQNRGKCSSLSSIATPRAMLRLFLCFVETALPVH